MTFDVSRLTIFYYFAGMKRHLSFLFFLAMITGTACKSKDKTPVSENDMDAARNFIRAALDGQFNEARTYLLPDSINVNWMDIAERIYQKADAETKLGYRNASINIHGKTKVNDSITVLIYSNTFMKNHDTLRVIKKNDKWLIDLKYLFQHSVDSLPHIPVLKDSIR